MKMLPDTVAKQAVSYNTANSGADSVVTLAAASGTTHVVDWIAWSYATAPTSGALTVSDGTTSFSIDVTASGPGQLLFGERGFGAVAAAAVTVTLADGTATKKLSVGYR
jgi:hypothetical protein